MPETLLFIGPKSAKALIDELQRRVEPLLRGRWTFAQLLVGPLVEGDLGEADAEKIRRRLERKDFPLPLVVWPVPHAEHDPRSFVTVFPTRGERTQPRWSLPRHFLPPSSREWIQRDGGIPNGLFGLLRRKGVEFPFVLMEVDSLGVIISGLDYSAELPQLPPLTDEDGWAKTSNALAEVLHQEIMSPLQGVEIQGFGPFQNISLTFCSGVNVLIGKNSTGKSWLMKLLYGSLRAFVDEGDGLRIPERLSQRLSRLYRPDDGRVGRLVKRRVGRGTASIEIKQPPCSVKFTISTQGKVKLLDRVEKEYADYSYLNPGSPVYLPSRDALALYEGFIAAYERRELSFDETVYHLCVALSATPLRGPRSGFAKSTLDELERTLGGSIRLKGNRFYLVSNDGQGGLEAHLLSEGLRKVGTLAQLITNGTLQRGSILFWDEPEANLNPRLIVQMANVLRQLAALGVQVFLATHDYLLTQRLSMEVEYERTEVPLRFISLYRDEEGEIRAEQGDTLVDLEHNDIQDEFRLLYEHELNLAAGVHEESGA